MGAVAGVTSSLRLLCLVIVGVLLLWEPSLVEAQKQSPTPPVKKKKVKKPNSPPPPPKKAPPAAKASPPAAKASPPAAKSTPPAAKIAPPTAKSAPPAAKSAPPAAKSAPPSGQKAPPAFKIPPAPFPASPPAYPLSPPAYPPAVDPEVDPPAAAYTFPPPAMIEPEVVAALLSFKDACTPASWESLNAVGWREDVHPCMQEWTGVLCLDGQPAILNLAFASLEVAQLPAELSGATTLEEFVVSQNEIGGTLPAQWSTMPNLMYVDVSGNLLQGSIPNSWNQMPTIDTVAIGSNPGMCGPIPSDIPQVTRDSDYRLECPQMPPSPVSQSLEDGKLLMTAVDPTGSNPDLTNWSEDTDPCDAEAPWLGVGCANGAVASLVLRDIRLIDAQIGELGQVTTLTQLELVGDDLKGELPVDLSTLIALRTLNVGNNKYTGQLPEGWSNLGNLLTMDLSDNDLMGAIPSAWPFGMGSIQTLIFDMNPALCDNIPPGFLSPSRNLTISTEDTNLGVSCFAPSPMFSPPPNSYTVALMAFKDGFTKQSWDAFGPVGWDSTDPCSLPGWTGVRCVDGLPVSVDLFQQNLSMKQLPNVLTGVPSLQSLGLAGNKIEGTLPAIYTRLRALNTMDMGSNLLRGVIPPAWSNMASLNTLILYENDMCGPIPPNILTVAKDADWNVNDTTC